MKQVFIVLICFFLHFIVLGQDSWSWTTLSPLPIKTSSNALCESINPQGKFVYSFGGMKDSLSASSVHQRTFKYDVLADIWTETDSIPDTSGVINAFANAVGIKIYLIGGEYVLNDSTTVTSDKVHIYNALVDTFENDGAQLPTPVSSQVQAVWRDSLIYVISGLSNGLTTPAVQIYNPSLNNWNYGTPVPNTGMYECYGASGYILGDTIYYFGGAVLSPSPSTVSSFRKGLIDPQNPYHIDWYFVGNNIGSPQYKSVCSGHNQTLFWVGGASKTYNLQAKNTQDSTVVHSNERLMDVNVVTQSQKNSFDPLNTAMDLGGIANLGGGNWIIAGGIDSLNQATNATFLIHNPSLTDIKDALHPPFFEVTSPNNNYFLVKTDNIGKVAIFDMAGRLLQRFDKNLADLKIMKSTLPSGMILFVYNNDISLPVYLKKFNP